MTRDEFKKFFAYISAVTTDTNPSAAKVQVYWDALNDLNFDVAMIAAKKIIATLESPFLPMPAIIRKAVVEITQPPVLTAGEAYEKVLKAINRFGSYKETEALESLDLITRKATQAIGWKSLCLSEEPDVVRGQWRKAYEAIAQREQAEAKVPQSLKELTSRLGEKMSLPEFKHNARPLMSAEEAEKFYL